MEWISVEDRLPEIRREVITFTPGQPHPVCTAWHWGKDLWFRSTSSATVDSDTVDGDAEFQPTHWMPLPDPPKSLQNP